MGSLGQTYTYLTCTDISPKVGTVLLTAGSGNTGALHIDSKFLSTCCVLSLVLGATESPEINKTCPDISKEITGQDLWIGNSGGENVSLRKGYFTSNLRPKMCGCGGTGRIGEGEHILGEKECLLNSRM